MAVLLFTTISANAQQRKPGAAKARPAAATVNRPKLPIEYVKELNLGAATEYNQSSQYEDRRYSDYLIRQAGYHMPTIEEWAGVFPLNGALSFEADDEVLDNYEAVTIAGETFTFESDYQRNDRICYALRFKDEANKYLCAYRYKRMGRWVKNSYDSGVEVLVIYLGPSFKGSLQTIANEAYWTKNKAKAIRRYFPAPGFRSKDYPGMTDSMGTLAYYWTTEPNIVLEINVEGVHSGQLQGTFQSVSRPFINK